MRRRICHQGASQVFEIGSPDVTTYGGMIREYARQSGLKRWLIRVPVLTPYLSSLWLTLVTPTAFKVGRHLIEGLKNPTVVRDKRALNVFSIRPASIQDAIGKALRPDKRVRQDTPWAFCRRRRKSCRLPGRLQQILAFFRRSRLTGLLFDLSCFGSESAFRFDGDFLH